VLYEPAQSLTDLALGLITLTLAIRLRREAIGQAESRGGFRAANRYWRTAFWWFGFAALAGAVHHGLFNRWERAGEISWTIISVIVVVAVSYVLAATVADVLGPGRARAFWILRSFGLSAYLIVAVTGHAGVGAILACESLTMLSVLALWGWAAWRRHPMAPAMVLAILTSGGAAGLKALSPRMTEAVGLDPTSIYHLAQILGTVLLYDAVRARRAEPAEVPAARAVEAA
jgi:hypothetical protein